MAQRYVKDQPQGFTNRNSSVAIVGAGGLVGKYMTAALLATGKHTITALTRAGSTSALPDGVHAIPIDYAAPATLAAVLQNQQALFITHPATAPPSTHSAFVRATLAAGLPYVMPNCYGADVNNAALTKDMLTGDAVRVAYAEIAETGAASTALVCGLWYEYSLTCGLEWFGFDFAGKKLMLYDDGAARINVSMWEQCGRAVAAWLSLKEMPVD